MCKKKLAILIFSFVLIMACFSSGAVFADKGNGAAMESETKERLMEKYDLVEPELTNPKSLWSQSDFGVSNPIAIFVGISRLYLNPYVFAAQEMINHLIDRSRPH
ncbi:hypothetical protein NSQ90_11475 [Paenibacillus sp. FSL H7-0737]|uniref:hypothetical protein n=1 Tax=Paenibacillus sp. FSL H7-0737 TaxID=1536775 RepID=UPI0004F5A6B3|nr:hypothetical protein [Paenibacillus sp. FSL H7-0737]AIQ23440.1 hypothetical protein H70737_11590 [Paenibacillus sp. FSL H7-0737]